MSEHPEWISTITNNPLAGEITAEITWQQYASCLILVPVLPAL